MNNQDSIQPVFIFSLPRAGSTLLQRILASNSDISTVSEPWILLPLFSYSESLMTWSAYSGKNYRTAIKDLIKLLPEGEDDVKKAAHAYAMSIYETLGKDKRYFLDKTPRYHLIASKIIETFPNAKFIFLWRNPLSIMASISKTWKKNRWTFEAYKIDLYQGQDELIQAYTNYESRCLSLRYEDLTTRPDELIAQIESYLELPNGSCSRDTLSTLTKGKMGDPTGAKEYANEISTNSIDRWHEHFQTKLRKKTAYSYLNWLGEKKLATMGYSKDSLIETLDQLPIKSLGLSDYYHRFVDSMRTRNQSKLVKTLKKRKTRYRLR